jgi:alpha-glucosidase
MWTDINYMDHRRIFTLDPGNYPIERMQDLIEYLHNRDQHYILMVDPAVADYDYDAYNRGREMDVFVKRKDGQEPFRGVVWPVRFPFPSPLLLTEASDVSGC